MRAAIIAIWIVVAAAPAAAQDADTLFEQGKRQLAAKQYAKACATFEKVDSIDPGIGAKLNVAKCYQEWGKLARAHRWYTDAEKMAVDTRDARAPKIKELIAALDPDVPRLTIRVPAGADAAAASITLDGAAVASSALGRETRVDPGPHEIAYRVSDQKKRKTVAMERGGKREITLELPSTGVAVPVLPDSGGDGATGGDGISGSIAAPSSSARPGRTRRIVGLSLAAAGVVSFGVASYLALDARSDYNSAIDDHCFGSKGTCTSDGIRLTSDARSQANLGTVFAIVGVAAAAGGVVLYLTAPSGPKTERATEAMYVAPILGDGAGLVLGGRY